MIGTGACTGPVVLLGRLALVAGLIGARLYLWAALAALILLADIPIRLVYRWYCRERRPAQ